MDLEAGGFPASGRIEQVENQLTDAGERRLFRVLVLETLRHRTRLDHMLEGLMERRGIGDLPAPIRWILRLGATQLALIPWIPAYAAVNSTVNLASAFGHAGTTRLVNAVLRRISRDAQALWEQAGIAPVGRDGAAVEPAEALALGYSHPLWLVQRWIERWGQDRTEAILAWGNELPDYWIRRNPGFEPADRVSTWPPEGAHEGWIPGTARFPAGSKPADHPDFAAGAWTIQDGSGVLVTRLVPRVQGLVLDLCAAPGTKTGALLENAGSGARVIALDLSAGRLRRAAAGLSRIGWRTKDESANMAHALLLPVAADGRSLPVRPPWDGALVDAPCSNLGVIRRRPDLKWRCSETEVARLAGIQSALLDSAAGGVVPGGWLVYSVCTVEPEETTAQRDRFLSTNPGWSPGVLPDLVPEKARLREGEMLLLPGEFGTDGAYAFIAIAAGAASGNG